MGLWKKYLIGLVAIAICLYEIEAVYNFHAKWSTALPVFGFHAGLWLLLILLSSTTSIQSMVYGFVIGAIFAVLGCFLLSNLSLVESIRAMVEIFGPTTAAMMLIFVLYGEPMQQKQKSIA